MPSATLPLTLPATLLDDPLHWAYCMTQIKGIEVRLKTLAGRWETVGVDRMRGIWPEVDQLVADEWGPASASFNLHRDPGITWPDLGAFSDVEIDVGGRTVWDGRISETPVADGDDPVVNVQCEGWRAHLDDDTSDRSYVHTRLTDYKDTRSMPATRLAQFPAGAQVSADRGAIQLAFPAGLPLAGVSDVCGVTLDLGATNSAKRIVVEWESSNNAGSVTFYARASESQDGATAPVYDAFTFTLGSGASGTTAGTFTTAARYVHLFIFYSGAPFTVNADIWVKIKGVKVFSDTAYESANASILKAPTIVRDALDRTTILLSADRSGINDAAATFNFESFSLEASKTGREIIDAANAPMDWRTKVAVGRRMIFAPKPAVAALEVGEWPGSQFADASSNGGKEIYNRVVVEGTGADGQPVMVERSASQQAGVVASPLTSPAPDNPSFATNTSSWTPGAGSSITRDTATFDSSPASGRWDRGVGVALGAGDTLTETFSGTFLAGVTYTLQLRGRPSATTTSFGIAFGPPGGGGPRTKIGYITTHPGGVFNLYSVSWTPTITTSGTTLVLSTATGGVWWHIDSLQLTAAQPTLVDRRGFKRTHVLPVKSSLTATLGEKIADTFLAAHKTTPLKGTVKATGDGAVRDILTGRPVAPEELLLRTGEMLRLSHRVDPDTGAWGRDGRIAEVTYRPMAGEATCAIDSRRTSMEAMLERLAIVVGTG